MRSGRTSRLREPRKRMARCRRCGSSRLFSGGGARGWSSRSAPRVGARCTPGARSPTWKRPSSSRPSWRSLRRGIHGRGGARLPRVRARRPGPALHPGRLARRGHTDLPRGDPPRSPDRVPPDRRRSQLRRSEARLRDVCASRRCRLSDRVPRHPPAPGRAGVRGPPLLARDQGRLSQHRAVDPHRDRDGRQFGGIGVPFQASR